jgi:hypothetical protein
MGRTGRKLVSFGWRGMLALVGGVASLGWSGVGCWGNPPYGPVPDSGLIDCTSDAECVAGHGKGWYCRPSSSTCGQMPPDGG